MGNTDQQLLYLARAGDRSAAERLLFAYAPRALNLIRTDLPKDVAQRVSAEDVLQESLVCALREIQDLKQAELPAFVAWFFQIAKRKRVDAIKEHRALKRSPAREQRAANVKDNGVGELLAMIPAMGKTPSADFRICENAAAVRSALATLSPDCRQAIELRYIQGLDVSTTAARMNKSKQAVHMLCYRGLRALREALGRASQFFTFSA
jgi:RNA polymerase sigma-70 factor (ECF subfamily)